MIPASTHRDRAAEAASYADRLQGDLASLRQMLSNYSSKAIHFDTLEDASARAMRQLEAISQRLDALGSRSDHGKYRLSDQEHAALDAARDLRTRMMDTLSHLQQAERSAHRLPN